MKVKKMTQLAILLALAIILHFVESLIQLPLPIPGIKLGLANIIGLVVLELFTAKDMLMINFLRVIFASLLRGSIFSNTFFLSLSGVMLSSIMVIILKKYSKMSFIGLSIASASFHTIGQITMAIFLYDTIGMIGYMPLLLYISIVTGYFVGKLALSLVGYLKKTPIY